MCGLAGQLDLDWRRPIDAGRVAAMTATLSHRGPDDQGYHNEGPVSLGEGPVSLGFRRLSIMDIAGGHQPMTNEDGSVILVCNGEIYNAPELRARLEARGHRFRSRCDVEVVLHLYEDAETDADVFRILNGQFAMAILDRRRRRLVLARDPAGICPLYYTIQNRTLLFASEIKALLNDPEVPRRVNLTGLDQVLTFPGLLSPTTLFESIHSLPHGHYAVAENGHFRAEEYWDLIYPTAADAPRPGNEDEYRDELEALLVDSVRRRLQSDVPVGCYLSGGLDSSLITALAVAARPGHRHTTFSITFPGNEMDESGPQALMARHLGAGIEVHPIPFDWPQIVDQLPAMILHAECPLKESYNSCSLALSAAARAAGVPVVLTGEGADELFAGYIGYRFDRFTPPSPAGDDLDQLLEADLREQLWGDPALVYETDHLAFREIKTALYSEGVAQCFPAFDCLEHLPIRRDRLMGRDAVHRRSYLDFKLRLVDHLVSDHGDRMAMANSVEARFPFLDRDLIDFATRLPPDLKLKGWQEKYLIKQVARRWLPETIVNREKFGFHGPGSPYLLRHARPWIDDILSYDRIARQGYFNPDTVEFLKSRYREDGFRLNLPFETDLLLVVLTFSLFLDVFSLPDLA